MPLHRNGNHASEVLVAHQPSYLPWQGYFARLLDADRLVLLDHVQFAERGVQHRNWIRGHDGGRQRLSVPVRRAGRFPQPIRDVEIADPRWAQRHWRTLCQVYRRARWFDLYGDELRAIYRQPWTTLCAVNTALIELVTRALGLTVHLTPSSELAPQGTKTAMLVDLCHRVGASTLRVGTGAPRYLDTALLARESITVEIATYTHHPYHQGRDSSFVPGLAALDVLLHHGVLARDILAARVSIHPWQCAARPPDEHGIAQ
ncbi:WbqC family protein [Amycolatopsis sp. NPDC059021]|uniref:WbqC family protein n=1 Tax=Amycolatopsis sp. NPDC059021 TaxID=3346704 RepID=UPI00366E6448